MGRVKHLNDVEGDNSIEVWEMDEYDNNKHMPTLNPLIPIRAIKTRAVHFWNIL